MKMKAIDFSNVTVTIIDKNKPGIVFPKGVRPDNLNIISKEQLKYKYSRKEIIKMIKKKCFLGNNEAKVIRWLLAKSTTKNHIPGVGKKVTRPKPKKIEEIKDYDDVKGFWTKNKTNIKINEIIQVINYLIDKI